MVLGEKITSKQLQLIYEAAGDYHEILNEACVEFNLQNIWDLTIDKYWQVLGFIKQRAITAPRRYRS